MLVVGCGGGCCCELLQVKLRDDRHSRAVHPETMILS
ncbi:hypothetical protein RB213_005304 [Colletotrichum asianum]